MSFPRPRTALFLLVPLTVIGCSLLGMRASAPEPPPEDFWDASSAWTARTLETMTLEQKVSQLFATRAYGYYTSQDDPAYRKLVDLVERFEIGGVIFFQGDPVAQALMANDLQRRARVPLLISQDMEWGPGMRVERTTTFPRTMATGATRNPDFAYTVGYVTAREARALGTHHVYAPVADVNNNPLNPIINVRSFGEDPYLVADMVTAFVRGMQDGGVMATVKHFPGHGDTDVDSHLDLPVIPYDRTRLDSLELVPFRAAIRGGVMSVMTAHLAFPRLEEDPNVPGTLSPRITTDLLRRDLGFRGLVVTDGLEMQGVTKHFGVGEAAVRALEAGADVLLLSTDEYAARAAVLKAIRTGRLSEARIDRSVHRILRAKEWAGLPQQRAVDLYAIGRHVHTPYHQALAEIIARASLTLLRNEGDLLPLLNAPRLFSVTLSDSDDPSTGQAFLRQLRAHGTMRSLQTRLLDRRSDEDDVEAILTDVARSNADVVIVPTYLYVRDSSGRIGLSDEHRRFLDRLIALGKPVVVISFGNPYMVIGLERQPAVYLAAYGASEASQKAAAQALFGQARIDGRLPITIPGVHAFGEGLTIEQATLRRGFPEEVGLRSHALLRIDSLLRAAIDERAFPGAAVAVGRAGVLAKLDGYGYLTYDSETPVTPRTLFDLASLTKVVATTTAAMKLYEEGRLDLDAPVVRYLPAFGANGKDRITIRQLLTHTSGLVPFRPFHTLGLTTRDAVIQAILNETPVYEPGTDMRYSDLGMITLALVIERITGQDFATYVREAVFEPLGMTHTGFRPVGQTDASVVPTEYDNGFRKRLIQGEVHDETAWILGGTAGHAGLFSTAEDLARFAHMLVNEGRVNGQAFLQPETIRLFTTPVAPGMHTRALGWDTRSPEGYSSAGQYFGPRSFGHTGFTGTSLWIDPDQQLYVILLTNRVYPTRENRAHIAIRPQVADFAYEAIAGPPAPLLPGQAAGE
ncbi:beta-N-acetylglucosaminidase [Rhodothermaceae bacterium RA]|nr:beta-N-acetylglucosaminidase [Rhodothermaceae bacterium RA]